MQGTIIGVSRMSGIGKESKSAYDMCRALMLNPITDFSRENFKRIGFGFEVVEVELLPESFEAFRVQKYPLTGEFDVAQLVRGGKLASVITGFKKAA